jgi:hypothetical protein
MKGTVVVTALALIGLAQLGCGISPDYVEDSEADVILYVTSMNGGNVLQSDVREGADSFTVVSDTIPVGLANRSKNPSVTVVQVARAILLDRYTVSYFRSDGRNTQGVDVPYTISGEIRSALDLGDNITVNIEVVRAQAKFDPPLTNIKGSEGALGGSALLFTCFAEVTLYGHTPAGKTVQASGRMQIDFADYGD